MPLVVALAVGFTRFSHTDPDVVDEGTRGFTITLTVVVDVALGAYAFVVAYIRRSIVMATVDKKQERETAASQAQRQAVLSAAPEARPGVVTRARAYVGDRFNRFFGRKPPVKASASLLGRSEGLPLLALNVKR